MTPKITYLPLLLIRIIWEALMLSSIKAESLRVRPRNFFFLMDKGKWKPLFSILLKYVTCFFGGVCLFFIAVPLPHFRSSLLLIAYVLTGPPAFSLIPFQSVIILTIGVNIWKYKCFRTQHLLGCLISLALLIQYTLPWLKTL